MSPCSAEGRKRTLLRGYRYGRRINHETESQEFRFLVSELQAEFVFNMCLSRSLMVPTRVPCGPKCNEGGYTQSVYKILLGLIGCCRVCYVGF